MKYVVYLPFLIFCCINGLAQKNATAGKGLVTGKIVEANTSNPIEYATVTIYPAGSKKPVDGIVTNAKGIFKVDALAIGSYTVVIESIGYALKTDSIRITNEKPVISLGNISLSGTSQVLQNVTVTAAKPIIENKIDKMVYNAERDITSQGGVATDVLKKIPQVFVDVEGNVELQGSSSIRFLINGKPSTIFGNSVADALQSIPASQIQSIEVITSPGAKYDIQGTGGIINIILKKSTIRGINGSVNLSAGTRLENGSFNLNYRHNNFGVNAYFSGNGQLRTISANQSSRVSTDTARRTKTSFLQDGSSSLVRNSYQTGIGFDWSLSKRNNITGSLGYHHFINTDQGTTYQESILTDYLEHKLSDTNTIRSSENNFHNNSIDWSLSYKKTFKKDGQELAVSYNTSYGNNNSYYSQSQRYMSSSAVFGGSNSSNPGKNTESEFTIDYSHPISEKLLLETGVKNVENKINNVADVYVFNKNSAKFFLDPNQSYALTYNRNVYAYYLSTTFSLAHFLDVKAGGRYEYTVTKADYSNAHNVHIPSYSIFAPSFIVSHSFAHSQSIKLSYTYRIERPEYRELNPFVNLSDPHNISTGNPLLRPEKGNNFELGYNHSFEGGSNIYISFIYRRNSGNITNYTTYYPSYKVGDSTYTDVSVSTRQNINSEERLGGNISGTLAVSHTFTLRSNVFLFDQRVTDNSNGGIVRSAFGYRMNLNGTYQVGKTLALEFFGNFRSKETTIQGSQTSFISYNAAMRKQFLNKKLSIGLTAANPFSKYVSQARETFGANFNQISVRHIPYRSFGINLMYKFGKLEFKKSKEDDQNNQSAPF